MKVALVHDWLTGMRGGERCLQAFLSLYPQADIFTLLHVPGTTTPQIDARVKGTSFISKLPGASKYYRALFPLFPFATKQLKVQEYDLVISLSHACAKNVTVGKNAMHLCYCFTPMRYIWDQARTYFGSLTPIMWPIIRALRKWDRRARVDSFVAISRFVTARIRCFYRRSSTVIYPPVETSWLKPLSLNEQGQGEAFLYAGAFVPYKRPDIVVQAFNELGLPLWMVGKGPMEKKLRALAGPNVTFFGAVPDQELADIYRRCRALIFPVKEDFGMIPVECLATGRPVIGLYAGGLKDSLVADKPWDKTYLAQQGSCGVWISNKKNQLAREVIAAVRYFVEHEATFSVAACRHQAEQFSLRTFVNAWTRFSGQYGPTALVASSAGADERNLSASSACADERNLSASSACADDRKPRETKVSRAGEG